MTEKVITVSADDSLTVAAQKMKETDCGVLPVGKGNDLQGMITDRDIVIRAIAEGKDPAKEKVADYMTDKVYACNEDDFLEDAADKMRGHNVSRLIVRNHEGKVTGILSFGNILRKNADADEVAKIVERAVFKVVA
ncbi:MAG: CBS domain-containing protein [Rhodospirillales bacterium]|nr:CBS domain-containing protein [Rhodospirillales bacterium]